MKTHHMLMLATAPVALLGATPASAQAVAVADVQAAVKATNAYRTAMTAVTTRYKADLDRAEARDKAIQAEIDPLIDALDTNKDGGLDQQELAAAQAAKRPELATLQQKQQARQQEIGALQAPAARAEEYILEQIAPQVATALKNAITKKGVTILLRPSQDMMYVAPAASLNQTITDELNILVKTADSNPPATWQPGQRPAGAPAPAAPGKPPQGR